MKPIATYSRTTEILEEFETFAKKKYGQNFINDPSNIESMCKGANLDKNTHVIEVGPGLGALTEGLCQYSKDVLAYDIDEDAIQILSQTLAPYNNVEVIHQDFLTVDLGSIVKKYEGEPLKIVANLPYYITSDLLEKIILNRQGISEVIVMVQKEVAKKFCSGRKDKNRQPIHVLLEKIAKVEYLFTVSQNVFLPKPNVDSAMMKITFNADYDCNEEALYTFFKQVFHNRRKTIVNNLKGVYTYEMINQALDRCGLSLITRAESLDEEQLENLYFTLKKGEVYCQSL